MTQAKPASARPVGQAPNRLEKLTPVELVSFSGILALFAGVVVLISTREIILSVIILGIAFIVSWVTLSMLGLGMKANNYEHLDSDQQHPAPGR